VTIRSSEAIVLVYLGYLVLLALVRPLLPRRRAAILTTAGVDAALIVWLSREVSPAALAVRDWLPAGQILIGYWLSGPFFQSPMRHIEARLSAHDRWWFDAAGLAWFARRGPRLVLELLELAYTSAYVVVPAGFALARAWSPGLDADRYWTGVVAAELACYGALPWIQTRTPGSLGDQTAIDARSIAVRRFNRRVQQRASIQVNTFPSGHAAGAMATALAAGLVVPSLITVLMPLALVIALASVIGRYHYALDSVLGLAVGAVAAALAR
jgi:membrane-associated phospholipid phosphatase